MVGISLLKSDIYIYNLQLYEFTFYIPFLGSGPQGLWDVSRCNRSSICQIGQPPQTRDLKNISSVAEKITEKRSYALGVDSAFNKDGLDMAWHITCIHPSRHDHTHSILETQFWIFWENCSSTSICSDGSPPGLCWLCLKRFNDWNWAKFKVLRVCPTNFPQQAPVSPFHPFPA